MPKPVSVARNSSGKSLSQLFDDGEIDATIGAACEAPVSDFKEVEKQYWRDLAFSLSCILLCYAESITKNIGSQRRVSSMP